MLLRNHCFRGKAKSITHSEFVFLALVIQRAMGMCHSVIYGLPSSTIIFTLSNKQHDFRKKKKVMEQKKHVLIFSMNFV